MFDIGWGELLVIGIVALVAIGPKELPTVLRTLGQWMAKLRRMAAEFQGQFQEALREAEMADLKKHADDISTSVSSLANIYPLAEEARAIERIGEGAGELPSSSASAEAPAPATAATETPAALPTSEEVPLPQISVPLPEPPAPLTEKDFAAAEPDAAKEPQKQAGGGA